MRFNLICSICGCEFTTNQTPENPVSDICDNCIDIQNGIYDGVYIDEYGNSFD